MSCQVVSTALFQNNDLNCHSYYLSILFLACNLSFSSIVSNPLFKSIAPGQIVASSLFSIVSE
jgi:hypothetical protein